MNVLVKFLSEPDAHTVNDIIETKFTSIKNEVLFDVLMFLKDGKTSVEVISILNSGVIGWNHSNFNEIAVAQAEIFSYIECPYEIIDGMFSCSKCGNKKTISYSKQTRSADEGMTTFVFCANKECRHHWTYKG